MALSVISLKRIFQCGATRYPDPAPHLPPEEALRAYPQFAGATLSGPTTQGDEMVFTIDKSPVGTKG